jgi:hypothetical protein
VLERHVYVWDKPPSRWVYGLAFMLPMGRVNSYGVRPWHLVMRRRRMKLERHAWMEGR